MEIELKRLEDLADAIVNDFAYMRQREQEMRDTNGKYFYCSSLLNSLNIKLTTAIATIYLVMIV